MDAGEMCTVRVSLKAPRTWARSLREWKSAGDAVAATTGAHQVSLINFGKADRGFNVGNDGAEFARRRSSLRGAELVSAGETSPGQSSRFL